MGVIELEKLSSATIQRLQRLAQSRGVGVETEAVECLERGLSEIEQVQAELEEIRTFRESLGNVWITDDIIRAARDEGRA